MGFRSVYKRHTPFAMSLYEQVVQGNRRIVLDKTGDILMYVYLYREGQNDWTAVKSIEFHIGGKKINEWDVNFLCGIHPKLFEPVYSKIHTDTTSLFLPIPIPPLLPVKNLRYHEVEIIINWVGGSYPVRCFTMFAFTDEALPDASEMLIQQVRRYNVYDGVPMKMFGLIKCLTSDSIAQPTNMNVDGYDVHIQPEAMYTLYHSRFTRDGFSNERRYAYADIGTYNVRTAQRAGEHIFILSSTSPAAKIYDTNKFFGANDSYEIVNTNVPDVWSSCVDGSGRGVYASGLSGQVVQITQSRSVVPVCTVPHNVYYTFYYSGTIFMVGTEYVSYFRNGVLSTVYLNGGTYDGAFQLTAHPTFGDSLVLFRNDGTNGILVFDEKLLTFQTYPLLTFSDAYDRFSSSILLDGSLYFSSGIGDTFARQSLGVFEEVVLKAKESGYYTTLVYDGTRYLYVYGEKTVVRFEAMENFMFVPFCTDVQDRDSTGFVNFDPIQNVIFTGCGNGHLYAVRYNFLRIRNGMAGLLYS